ncbi:MAG: NUDIX domain-containing protein [Caldilineaceae bacterium]
MKIIDKLAWLHLRERRLLCCRSHGRALFYLPGGKREAGESDTAALLRELHEELTVTLKPTALHFAVVIEAPADGQAAGTLVRLTCYFGDYTGALQPSREIAEIAWLTAADQERASVAAYRVIEWLQAQGLLD